MAERLQPRLVEPIWVSGHGVPAAREDRDTRGWIPPSSCDAPGWGKQPGPRVSPWLAVRVQSPLVPRPRHCPLCRAPWHWGTPSGLQRPEGLVTPGAAATLSLLPKARVGGKGPAPVLMQPWPKRPMAHLAGAGKAPRSSQEPRGEPAPTTGVGDGSG